MNLRFLLTCFLFATLCSNAPNLWAQPEMNFELVATGFSLPTDIAHAGDERLFVVEKGGKIRILDKNKEILPSPFLDITPKVNSVANERGLLGLAFHPEYSSNGWFFVHYNNASGNTQISRFSVSNDDPNKADPESEISILEVDQPYNNHNGGDLNFGPDGYLYIGLGDGGAANDPQRFSQNGNELLGKMLRIDVSSGDTYTIPESNPFVNDPDVLDEIWATGLRNPWRFSFDRQTGDLWIGDVGQNNVEEISFQAANSQGGENYGWVCFEGNRENIDDGCDEDELTYPIFQYTVSEGRSITGGYVYRGNTYPDLKGYYLLADFVTNRFWTIKQEENGSFSSTALGKQSLGSVSTFGEDVNGELFLASYSGGAIFQVTTDNPVTPPPPSPEPKTIRLANFFLEGFYDIASGEMTQNLRTENLFPENQPFNIEPWNYNGPETLANVEEGYVDWILVQLRDSTGSVLEEKACILTATGDILSAEGENEISFSTFSTEVNSFQSLGYVVVVRHKSHLAVAFPLNDGLVIDPNNGSLAVGNEQLKEVEGIFTLYSGDYDGNGIINNLDFNIWSLNGAALNQYLSMDADGNGVVNNKDFNLWALNRSKVGSNAAR